MVVALLHPSGDRVIVQEDEAGKPERFTTAFCGAASSSASFMKKQASSPDFDGNYTPRNFEQLAGTVYKLATTVPTEDLRYCLLLTADAAKQHTLVPVTIESKPCEKSVKAKFAKLSKDKLTKCTEVASAAGSRFVMLEYARKKRVNPVVRFVASFGERVVVTELKATAFDGPSCWRVDDSCEPPVGSYVPLLAMKRGDEFTLLIQWGGAEGDSMSLEVSEGATFKSLSESYFYNSP